MFSTVTEAAADLESAPSRYVQFGEGQGAGGAPWGRSGETMHGVISNETGKSMMNWWWKCFLTKPYGRTNIHIKDSPRLILLSYGNHGFLLMVLCDFTLGHLYVDSCSSVWDCLRGQSARLYQPQMGKKTVKRWESSQGIEIRMMYSHERHKSSKQES